MAEVEAGPELDALVAERVFGYELAKPSHGRVISTDRWIRDEPGAPNYVVRIGSYSTTWDGAGLVIERMRKTGWSFTLNGCAHDEDGKEWLAEFSHDNSGREVFAPADTAPLAVCRAALIAVLAGEIVPGDNISA